MSFEEAIHNFKEPPTYPDPTVRPPGPKVRDDFHDEDEFSGADDEKNYGGWPNAPYGKDYYYLVIHTLLNRGVEPAPEKIRQLYYAVDKKNPDILTDIHYLLFTRAKSRETPKGWLGFESHERSGPIRGFIQDLPQNVVDNYWLLPVEDNGEYVSWDLLFVPKNEDMVIKQLMALSLAN